MVTSGAGLASLLLPAPSSLEEASFKPELAPYNPFLPPNAYFQSLKQIFFDPNRMKTLIPKLLNAFHEEPRRTYAEGLLIYCYLLWRALPKGEERTEVVRMALKIGEEVTKRLPRAPTGYFFTVMATGFTALTAGVINALHLIPTYQKMLLKAIEMDKTYMWGMPLILLGAMYMKLPPFPISIGSLEKAGEAFQASAPYARRKFGLWHSFYGEYLYLTEGIEAIRPFFQRTLKEFKPDNALHVFSVDVALRDLLLIEEAVKEGRYDKYLWSPLLIPAQPYGLKPEDL